MKILESSSIVSLFRRYWSYGILSFLKRSNFISKIILRILDRDFKVWGFSCFARKVYLGSTTKHPFINGCPLIITLLSILLYFLYSNYRRFFYFFLECWVQAHKHVDKRYIVFWIPFYFCDFKIIFFEKICFPDKTSNAIS